MLWLVIIITYSNTVVLADGTRKVYKGIKYICPNRARKRGECDGQTQYSSIEIDNAVLKLTYDVLDIIKEKPKDKSLKLKYNQTVEQKRSVYSNLIKSYDKQQEHPFCLENFANPQLRKKGTLKELTK